MHRAHVEVVGKNFIEDKAPPKHVFNDNTDTSKSRAKFGKGIIQLISNQNNLCFHALLNTTLSLPICQRAEIRQTSDLLRFTVSLRCDRFKSVSLHLNRYVMSFSLIRSLTKPI